LRSDFLELRARLAVEAFGTLGLCFDRPDIPLSRLPFLLEPIQTYAQLIQARPSLGFPCAESGDRVAGGLQFCLDRAAARLPRLQGLLGHHHLALGLLQLGFQPRRFRLGFAEPLTRHFEFCAHCLLLVGQFRVKR
jgi:hypothetical protein